MKLKSIYIAILMSGFLMGVFTVLFVGSLAYQVFYGTKSEVAEIFWNRLSETLSNFSKASGAKA